MGSRSRLPPCLVRARGSEQFTLAARRYQRASLIRPLEAKRLGNVGTRRHLDVANLDEVQAVRGTNLPQRLIRVDAGARTDRRS